MPIVVNGEQVPEEWIREERARVSRDLRWAAIPDPAQREAPLCHAAEHSAINRMLLEQAAAADPRPIDHVVLDAEVSRQKSAGGCGNSFDDTMLRQRAEKYLRIGRLIGEFTAGAAKPGAQEIEEFYRANREQFRQPDTFHASHIVVHVNEGRTGEQAEAAIRAALAELERGEDFAAVADRHSDCKGTGGDLGVFAAGYMVEEFERALRAVKPGERTGIFTTPFGFHIALLDSFERGGPASFDDVRSDIERVLAAMSEHSRFLEGVEELRRRATVIDAAYESPAEA